MQSLDDQYISECDPRTPEEVEEIKRDLLIQRLERTSWENLSEDEKSRRHADIQWAWDQPDMTLEDAAYLHNRYVDLCREYDDQSHRHC